ncbi:MAG: hypothetical protein JNK15_23425 [Planctomycetes bacterium]|nr:hypothetical protein [Planctomycetota bacterium]
MPDSAEAEWDALRQLLAPLPRGASLLHFGEALPRWCEQHAFARDADPAFEARFVDVLKRLKSAAVWPEPVFGLHDMVAAGLGRDPLRAGHSGAAAMWTTAADGCERLRQKLRADLEDLAALKEHVLDAEPTPVAADAAAASE